MEEDHAKNLLIESLKTTSQTNAFERSRPRGGRCA
jgi:hypothetical protein